MILDDIVAKRKTQLEREMSAVPFEEIKKEAGKAPEPKDFKSALLNNNIAVIAEVKKASPSKGVICEDFKPAEIAKTYEKAGANALSVLTEEFYFKGSSGYLKNIRREVSIPILRKDFIISPYQIYEARAIGADAILLIAAVLTGTELKLYNGLAHSLGLACLMEAHNGEELEKVLEAGGEIIGINNRDLKTFNVDLSATARLAEHVPEGKVIVSESGIKTNSDVAAVKSYGADAVLIGETLMRSVSIAETMRQLRANV